MFQSNSTLLNLSASPKLFDDCLEALQLLRIEASTDSVFYNDLLLLNNFSQTIRQDVQNSLVNGPRLLCSRLNNDKTASDVNKLLQDSFDTEQSHIINSLQTLDPPELINGRAPSFFAKSILFLGATCLVGLDPSTLPAHVTHLFVAETSARDLALALSLFDLMTLVMDLKAKQIKLTFILETEIESLKIKTRINLIDRNPTLLNGIHLIKSPLYNSTIDLFESWLRNSEGITQHVAGYFGGEIDEINQVLQACVNATNHKKRCLIPILDGELGPVVVVASGPSLDQSVSWLQKYQDKLLIVASGSSLGALLKQNITPDAVVFLERQSVVYETDLAELVESNIDLSSIILIGSSTLDPRISKLFSKTIWFHRPASSAIALFEYEADSRLLQSGPHSANAAIESVLYMGFRKILCLGCDFSAKVRSKPRATGALGNTPRNFDIPMPGRDGKTVFSNPELISASRNFDNAITAFEAELYSPPSGIKFNSCPISIVDLDETVAKDFGQSSDLSTLVKNITYSEVDLVQTSKVLQQSMVYLDTTVENIIAKISESAGWSANLSECLGKFISTEESNLQVHEIFVKRLVHHVLFFVFQSLYDSAPDEWEQSAEIAKSNLLHLNRLYTKYFHVLQAVLEDPKHDDFSWKEMKELVLKV